MTRVLAIDKDVPMQKARRGGDKQSQLRQTLPHLEVGDSVLAPFSDMKYLSQLTFISNTNSLYKGERQYITRKIDDQHNRIWRIK